MMAVDFSDGLAAVLEPRKRAFPCHVNRISSIDGPCERKLYYQRVAWDKATPIDDGLAGVFQTGNVLEPVIERIVSEVGAASDPPWRVVGAQTPTNDKLLKKYQIAGSIDGFLQVREEATDRWVTAGVVDIKTSSQNVYPQINSYADLGKFRWTRGYRGQLMLYAFAHDLERCYILFVNKGNLYDLKMIEFGVDLAYVERLLQRAERVNDAIKAEDPPEGVNDPDVCPDCPWLAHCAPSYETGGNLRVIDDVELEGVLDGLDALSSGMKAYKDLEKQRDLMLTR